MAIKRFMFYFDISNIASVWRCMGAPSDEYLHPWEGPWGLLGWDTEEEVWVQLAIKRGFYHPPPKVQLAIKGGRALYHPQCCCTRGWGAKVAAVSVIYSGVAFNCTSAEWTWLEKPIASHWCTWRCDIFTGAFNCTGAASTVLGEPGVGLAVSGGGALGSSYCHIYGRCIFTFTGLQFKLHPGLIIYLFKQSIKQFLNYHIYNQVLHHIGTRGVNSKMSTHPSIYIYS